jgi:hypothetical protein
MEECMTASQRESTAKFHEKMAAWLTREGRLAEAGKAEATAEYVRALPASDRPAPVVSGHTPGPFGAPTRRIEFPSVHNTFTEQEYGVFEYSEYPRSSVLAGQERRAWLSGFATLAEAQAAYPDATATGTGPQFAPVDLSHLPDDDDDQ